MPGSRWPRRPVSLAAGLVLATALMTSACGGTVEVPTPSGSRTVQLPSVSVPVPSISVPSVSIPPITVPTDGETSEPTAPPEPSETPEPTPEPTETPEPTPEPTETVTETATPTPEATETEEPSPTPSPSPSETDVAAPAPEDDEGGIPAWVWWLLGAAALAAGVFFVLRSRRRAAWDDDLTAAQAEVTWLARDLLPRLRATGSREAAAGAWAVSTERVQAVEDRLTWLEATAPTEPRRLRAEELRDAVRDAHGRTGTLTRPGPGAGFAQEVDAVVANLEGALRPAAERRGGPGER